MNKDKTEKMIMTRTRRIVCVIAICVVICSIALGLGVRAYNRASLPEVVNTPVSSLNRIAPPIAAREPQSRDNEPDEGEVITIRPRGFDPPEIVRTHGRFTLMVENRSGVEEVSLRLDREAGSRLHNVRVERKQLDWRQGVDLPPGTYILTEENHPEWVCRITITPR